MEINCEQKLNRSFFLYSNGNKRVKAHVYI